MVKLQHLAVPILGLAVCLASAASAAPKHKRARPDAAAAAPSVTQGDCPNGYKYVSGACVTPDQVASILYARAMAQCAAQIRINYNWCALGDYGPKGKDIFVFDQSPRGIQSSPGGAASDFRFKRDVTPVALRADGVTLYSFRYFGSDQVYVGVMAQQVAAVVPGAVTQHPDGFLYVYYDRLGLKMQTWEEWQANRTSAGIDQ